MANQYYPPAASSPSDAPDLFLCLTTDRDGRIVREYVASDELADFLDPPRTLDADFRRELMDACERLAKFALLLGYERPDAPSFAHWLHETCSVSVKDAHCIANGYCRTRDAARDAADIGDAR